MEAAQCGNGGRCDQDKVSKPRVVSIAATHDPESTFDTRDQSMTKILIELLREDPYPPCRTLVQRLGLKLHGFATDIMKRNQARREKQKRAKKVRVYDVDFFVPQLGSQQTLTHEDRFMCTDQCPSSVTSPTRT